MWKTWSYEKRVSEIKKLIKTDLLLERIRLLLDFAIGAGGDFIGLMNANLKQTKWATRYRETFLQA